MEFNEIREIGKKEIAYDRQVAMCGKMAADNVFYFFVIGYQKAFTDQRKRNSRFKRINEAIRAASNNLFKVQS